MSSIPPLTGPPAPPEERAPASGGSAEDRRAGRARRAPLPVAIGALAVSAAMLLPLAYLAVRAAGGGLDTFADVLIDGGTGRLIVRTLGLAFAVTAAAIVIGVPLAFLTTRTDLPGRRVFAVLTAVPLVIPTYVGAYTLIAALAPGGLVQDWLGSLGLGRVALPSPYGFTGAFLSLTLFTYPYVLLTVQGALRGLDPLLEEASRSLGYGPIATFRRAVLPQLRPAIGAGSLLVVLYVLSDFGAVSLMRYSTFTRAVYLQYQAAFDRTPAAILGLVLVALTVLVLVLEARYAGGRVGAFRPTRATTTRRPTVLRLGRWRWPAAGLCALVVLVALVLPLTVIGWWLVRGVAAGEPLRLTFVAAGNSLRASAFGALTAVAGAFPVALWAARYPGRASRLVERASFTGYALPGIVVALSLVFFGARYATPLYQTQALLVFAYVVLFLPQAVGSIRASLLQISPSLEDAARSLGSTALGAVRSIVLPLARRGAFAGGALVFLTAMKELPATLLLAPTGFDTLATEIWDASSEAFFARAAGPALVLVLLGSLPLAVLVARERDLLA